MNRATCECADPACRHNATRKEHQGPTCPETATDVLERIDMDGARVEFCPDCTADALESGVFALVEDCDGAEGLCGTCPACKAAGWTSDRQ